MSVRKWIDGWRFVLLALLAVAALRWAIDAVLDDPEISLVVGEPWEAMRQRSTAVIDPAIPGEIWFRMPKTDARLRLNDPQYGFVTPLARFFTIGFLHERVDGIRMSPQIEPLLLDDALKVVLDLQEQWREKGWVAMGLRNNPTIADTPEWRAFLRNSMNSGRTFWQAGDKYQVMLVVGRFKYSKRPTEERYLITLALAEPWVPFDEIEPEPDLNNPIPTNPRGASDANPCLHTIHGEQQGLITAGAFTEASVGNIYQVGHEDQIMIQALSHGIFVPKGSSTGRRMHKPLVITKVIDKSSPLINNALCYGELLSLCRVEWYRTSARGVQEHFYTMELEDAVIIGAEVLMPHCKDPETAHFTPLEKVHFSYRRITWKHEISRTMGADEWSGEA